MQSAAILTGDLVGSTRAGAEAAEAALAAIGLAVATLGQWSQMPPRLTRFRGDGWQCAVPLALGPRAALFITASLGSHLPSRIALGLGAVETWGRGPDLSAARGPALVASGHALDAMTSERLRLAPLGRDGRDLALMGLLAALAEWSPPQAEAMAWALRPDAPPQREISALLAISPQALSQRLRAARAPAILAALGLWEAALGKEEIP